MAALQVVNGTLHLTGINATQTDPCTELNSSLWLLCVSPHTSFRLQTLAIRLLQLHPALQAAISHCSASISPALISVLRPLSSVVQDLAAIEAMRSSLNTEPDDDGLIQAIQTQVALIEKDSRCHSSVWIEQDTQNALQPYAFLAGLFHQLVVRSRTYQIDDLSSTSMSTYPITIGTPQKEDLTPGPPNAHIAMMESTRLSVRLEKETEQVLSSKDLQIKCFKHYYSLGVVAGGNFGDIWQGKLSDGTDVAIKVWQLSSLKGDNHKILKRLTREIYNWSKFKHENIHQLLGVIMFQGRVGMVSKWMANGNLQEYLLEKKNADKYRLCTQVSKGVQYLHANNMIHGDLKATNILVSSDGTAMLTDFDHSIISNCSLVFSATTQNGGGTLRWMAPELLIDDNSRRNKETDMYALGMVGECVTVWYYMLTRAVLPLVVLDSTGLSQFASNWSAKSFLWCTGNNYGGNSISSMS
ncbi:unnamed protein product [Rhizoctonia solani]|uniref:Protein kinase domain-containing protein n=1 Tax=Rhizoctonia solani TaxID=456999 RepID=A0A8H3B225_9AGAM|nr:unnamed protein product [Rhizoctonia solani]CAE6445646.1 unnamed protein product [Rhizoctonia solani]